MQVHNRFLVRAVFWFDCGVVVHGYALTFQINVFADGAAGGGVLTEQLAVEITVHEVGGDATGGFAGPLALSVVGVAGVCRGGFWVKGGGDVELGILVGGIVWGDGVRALQVGRAKTDVTPATKAAVVARQGVEGFGGVIRHQCAVAAGGVAVVGIGNVFLKQC